MGCRGKDDPSFVYVKEECHKVDEITRRRPSPMPRRSNVRKEPVVVIIKLINLIKRIEPPTNHYDRKPPVRVRLC